MSPVSLRACENTSSTLRLRCLPMVRRALGSVSVASRSKSDAAAPSPWPTCTVSSPTARPAKPSSSPESSISSWPRAMSVCAIALVSARWPVSSSDDELVLAGSRASEGRLQRLGRSAHFEGDVVTLDAGLQREIDGRLDTRGIRKVDGAAHDVVRAAAKEDVAAFSNRHPSRRNRLGNRTDNPEIRGHVEPGVVVVDDNRFCRLDVDVERDAIEEAGLGGRGRNGRSRLDAGQQLRGQAHRLSIRAAKHGEASSQRGRLLPTG